MKRLLHLATGVLVASTTLSAGNVNVHIPLFAAKCGQGIIDQADSSPAPLPVLRRIGAELLAELPGQPRERRQRHARPRFAIGPGVGAADRRTIEQAAGDRRSDRFAATTVGR